MWFSEEDIVLHDTINVADLHGYVLPHAGTKYTGNIISHTLRFRPTRPIDTIIILYYPSGDTPDINGHFHEYYVPWKSLELVFGNITYIGYNINKPFQYDISPNTLVVVSADISHFLPFNDAIELENKAAHSIMFRQLQDNSIVDDMKTFRVLYDLIPDWMLQWVGRSRSPGKRGVGYLSFLIRETPTKPNDGLFITSYTNDMTPHECLGEWSWSPQIEQDLLQKVMRAGIGRLSGISDTPQFYTITYLYKDNEPFIRGWHGMKHNAFYLPEVFLENTFENGIWFGNKVQWNKPSKFDMRNTIRRLNKKANTRKKVNTVLYSCKVIHRTKLPLSL